MSRPTHALCEEISILTTPSSFSPPFSNPSSPYSLTFTPTFHPFIPVPFSTPKKFIIKLLKQNHLIYPAPWQFYFTIPIKLTEKA